MVHPSPESPCETAVTLCEVVRMSEKQAFVNLESLHTAQGRW